MTSSPSLQVIAMHGWSGDSRGWEPFVTATQALGWHWRTPERGYGTLPEVPASWEAAPTHGPAGRKVVIGHSLGPHLLPAAVLAQADAVVLLASFGRFIPEGREGRRLQSALAGMAAALAGNEAEAMLRTFLGEAAAPQSVTELPATILDAPLPAAGRHRLQADLELLERCHSLPEALPARAPCLIVEAGADRIVVPEARALLRRERPDAQVLTYPEAGHCLLGTPLVRDVITWIEAL